jgi:hypothetical protein
VPVDTSDQNFVGFVAEVSPGEVVKYEPNMIPFQENPTIKNVGFKVECTMEV